MTIGGCSVASIPLCIAVCILGIVTMSSGIPTSRCADQAEVTAQEKEDIDAGILWIGAPALVGGIIGMVGAAFGIFGGLQINKCGICTAAVVLGIGGGIIIFSALGALAWASVFSHLCDDYKCGECNVFEWRGKSDVCCKENRFDSSAICKETHDWACDFLVKKVLATIFAVVGSIVVVFASSLACGAACCCPHNFDELAGSFGPPGGHVVGQPVVGQPVGNAGYGGKQ